MSRNDVFAGAYGGAVALTAGIMADYLVRLAGGATPISAIVAVVVFLVVFVSLKP